MEQFQLKHFLISENEKREMWKRLVTLCSLLLLFKQSVIQFFGIQNIFQGKGIIIGSHVGSILKDSYNDSRYIARESKSGAQDYTNVRLWTLIEIEMNEFRNLVLVGTVLLLYSETMQEARTIFAGVPSMGDEPKGKVSHSWPQMTLFNLNASQ